MQYVLTEYVVRGMLVRDFEHTHVLTLLSFSRTINGPLKETTNAS